ncbi:MAG: FtsX-like permease family protein [Rhodothermales bacterium]|nr:FtsX-like permease family protein [Rhodothermales bacterium]
MDFRLFIARRYLVGRKRLTLISIITGISTVGVTVGVAALIIVLSVMNGFFDFVRDLLVSVDPHVRIEAVQGRGIPSPDSVRQVALAIPGVVTATPYVQGKALLAYEGETETAKVVLVRGIDPGQFSSEDEVDRTGFGSFNLEREDGLSGMVIGIGLARRFGLSPKSGSLDASRLGLLSAPELERRITQPFAGFHVPRFEVRGVYDLESGNDESRVYIAISEAQRLFRTGKSVTGIEIRLDDLEKAAAVKSQLQARLPSDRFAVSTWYDLQRSLYSVMKLEKWAATLILALIIVVAAFSIVASITMVVLEKRRDIGVLQAMGVSRKDIAWIFRLEGLLIGITGTIAGLVLGLGMSLAQKYLELVPLVGADSFLLRAYPVSIRVWDVAGVAAIALLLCVVASLYPASRAASVQPAVAVNVE